MPIALKCILYKKKNLFGRQFVNNSLYSSNRVSNCIHLLALLDDKENCYTDNLCSFFQLFLVVKQCQNNLCLFFTKLDQKINKLVCRPTYFYLIHFYN